MWTFQSTHPVWDATDIDRLEDYGRNISIHASRMGCDPASSRTSRGRRYFNPRIPYGMRQSFKNFQTKDLIFQSTHPVWDATGIYKKPPFR